MCGVLGGLEAIRVLQKLGFKPRRSIELVIFTAEEPTRFGIGCLGSRMMANVLTPRRRLPCATRKAAAWKSCARKPDSPAARIRRQPKGRFHQFVELHIEQGPLLEQEGIDVGLVTHIAAPASQRIVIEGEGGHAGGKLMPGRKDALAAAAELILALESAAKSTGAIDTVGTVGVCEVFPGAVNSIPSRVRLETDVRDIDGARRDRVLDALAPHATKWRARRGVKITTELVNADPPTLAIRRFSRRSKNRPSRPARPTRRWSAAPITIRSLSRIAPVPCCSFPAAAA
jgi:ureidoglycolate amidohydrolase